MTRMPRNAPGRRRAACHVRYLDTSSARPYPPSSLESAALLPPLNQRPTPPLGIPALGLRGPTPHLESADKLPLPLESVDSPGWTRPAAGSSPFTARVCTKLRQLTKALRQSLGPGCQPPAPYSPRLLGQKKQRARTKLFGGRHAGDGPPNRD